MKQCQHYIFLSLLAFCLTLCAFSSRAQQLKLGNNPTQINKAALLELQSWNQGLRLTRVDTIAVNAVISTLTKAQRDSTNGMIVFQVKDSSFYYRTGGWWRKLAVEDSIGIVSLNGLTDRRQFLKTGTSGDDFKITESGNTHYINLPDAGDGIRGVVNTKNQSFEGTKTFLSSPKVSTLHSGSVVFIGNDNSLSEDNSNFYWDKANKRLGIGTNAPATNLDVNGGFKLGSSGTNFSNMFSYTIANADIDVSGTLLNLLLGGKVLVKEYSIPGLTASAHVIVNPGDDFPDHLVIAWARVGTSTSLPGLVIRVGIIYADAALVGNPPEQYNKSLNFLIIQ